MEKISIYNADGRKMTLSEYFRTAKDKSGTFEVRSISKQFGFDNGVLVCGTFDQCKSDLDKKFYGMCLQGIEVDKYGTSLLVR